MDKSLSVFDFLAILETDLEKTAAKLDLGGEKLPHKKLKPSKFYPFDAEME